MATINATISINSDVMSSPVSISSTMTMTKHTATDGLEEATGLRAKKFAATSAVAVIESDEFTSSSAKAHKVYMRNTGSSKEEYFYVAFNASAAASDTTETIGKLYGGDWMLMPYTGGTNLTVAASTAEPMTLEYMVFADGMAK